MPTAFSVTLAVLCCMSSQPAAAGSVRNASTSHEYTNIRDAVAAAAPGDTLEVGSGHYSGALLIDRSLTLRGIDTGGGIPVIDGEGQAVAVLLGSSGITIDGLSVTSSGSPVRPYGIFSAYAEEACILARRTDGHVIRNSTITGCHYGIYLLESHDTDIEANNISSNRFGGIFVRNSRRDRILSNRIEANGYEGIGIGTVAFPPGSDQALRQLAGPWWTITTDSSPEQDLVSEDIDVSANTVTGHGHGGITVGYARRIGITRNFVADNGGAPVPKSFPEVSLSPGARVNGYGIALKCNSHENSVFDNDVRTNENTAILLERSYTNTIRGNDIARSEYGLLAMGSHGNVIMANSVSENIRYGILLERGASMLPPSVSNLLVFNDLTENGVNAFDTSGKDTAPPSGSIPAQGPAGAYLPEDLNVPNRWDDGTHGNRYSDFDEAHEGFVDRDADGVSETVHPIPGGMAVDGHPLSAERINKAEAAPLLPVEAMTAGSPACAETNGGCFVSGTGDTRSACGDRFG